MDWIDYPFYGEVATAIVAILGLLALLWARGLRLFAALRSAASALAGLLNIGRRSEELLDNLRLTAEIDTRLKTVQYESQWNGGGSNKDMLGRLESTMNLLVGQMRAHADADDDIVRLDANARGEVEWLARALMTWTERTSDELKGFGWMSSVHPDEREDVAEEFGRCVRHRRQFDAAFQIINRRGEVTMVRASFAPVVTRRLADSETIRWVGTMRRISSIPANLEPPERTTGQNRVTP